MSKESVQFAVMARSAPVKERPAPRGLWCDLCGYQTTHDFAGRQVVRPKETVERWQCSLCGLIKSYRVG